MKKKERADYIVQVLEDIYPTVDIPLDFKDAYTLLVAVLLSAQCTDERVNLVTPGLFAAADNPFDMQHLSVAEILEQIKTCGLGPTKAKNIKAMAIQLVEQYDGKVPNNLQALEKLAGVGHKTASVVMNQFFGEPTFPVDTHIHRLATRWRLTDGSNVKKTEADCKKLFAKDKWGKLHLQIIYYGREYCSARGCDGTMCQLCEVVGKNPKKQ